MKSAGSWNYFIIICLCFSLTPSLHVRLNNFSWHKLENFHHRSSASMKRYKSLFLLHFIWAFLRFYYSNFKFDKLFPSINTCRIVTMTRATINNHHHSHSYIVCSENCWSVAPNCCSQCISFTYTHPIYESTNYVYKKNSTLFCVSSPTDLRVREREKWSVEKN